MMASPTLISSDLINIMNGGSASCSLPTSPFSDQAVRTPSADCNIASQMLTIRMLMSGKEVGSIIGKRGDNVKKYREESSARINISDGSCPERIVTVTGTVDQIHIAFSMMCQKFEDDFTQSVCTNDDGIACPPVTLRLLVPATQCGSVIGKGGCKIKEIRELTGASIQVASEVLPNSSERTVTISGNAKAISKCIRHLCHILLESPAKGATIPYRPKPALPPGIPTSMGMALPGGPLLSTVPMSNGPMPTGSLPNTPLPAHFSGIPGGFSGCLTSGYHPSLHGSLPGLPGGLPAGFSNNLNGDFPIHTEFTKALSYGRPTVCSSGPISMMAGEQTCTTTFLTIPTGDPILATGHLSGSGMAIVAGSQGVPHQLSMHPATSHYPLTQLRPSAAGPAPPAPTQTNEMSIPNDLIGCIIGRGGTKINEIRQLSGAQIKISNCEDGSKERRITITGTPETICAAQYLINSSIELHKGLLAVNMAMSGTGPLPLSGVPMGSMSSLAGMPSGLLNMRALSPGVILPTSPFLSPSFMNQFGLPSGAGGMPNGLFPGWMMAGLSSGGPLNGMSIIRGLPPLTPQHQHYDALSLIPADASGASFNSPVMAATAPSISAHQHSGMLMTPSAQAAVSAIMSTAQYAGSAGATNLTANTPLINQPTQSTQLITKMKSCHMTINGVKRSTAAKFAPY